MNKKLMLLVALLAFLPRANAQAVRMRSNASSYTDSQGNVWSSDAQYCQSANLSQVTNSVSGALPAASDQALYQTYRYLTAGFSCTVPLANGAYQVTLKIDEPYWTTAGSRVFNVTLNGNAWLTNFDVVGLTGGIFRATDQTTTVNVTNGSLVIAFAPVSRDPFYCALSIIPVPSHSAALTWQDNVNPSGTTYNVYRSNGSPWNPILLANVPTRNYTDTTIVVGQTYTYKITAVVSGAESDGPFVAVALVVQ